MTSPSLPCYHGQSFLTLLSWSVLPHPAIMTSPSSHCYYIWAVLHHPAIMASPFLPCYHVQSFLTLLSCPVLPYPAIMDSHSSPCSYIGRPSSPCSYKGRPSSPCSHGQSSSPCSHVQSFLTLLLWAFLSHPATTYGLSFLTLLLWAVIPHPIFPIWRTAMLATEPGCLMCTVCMSVMRPTRVQCHVAISQGKGNRGVQHFHNTASSSTV